MAGQLASVMSLLSHKLIVNEELREEEWNISLQPYWSSLMAGWATTAAHSVFTPVSVMLVSYRLRKESCAADQPGQRSWYR